MEYKTPAEIAEEMKLNPETVRRMCKRGDMYAIKCGNQWRIPVGNPDQWQIPYVPGSTNTSVEKKAVESPQPREQESEESPRKIPSTKTNHSANEDVSDKRQPAKKQKKTGRNDPCPCGSGRKYKRCCLR